MISNSENKHTNQKLQYLAYKQPIKVIKNFIGVLKLQKYKQQNVIGN
tara:strand:- start:359 stop:499 length:141 start_codon:yes stop_codon:yes gene_type:complete